MPKFDKIVQEVYSIIQSQKEIKYKRIERESKNMVECIVKALVKKFGIERDVAALFFYEVYKRKKVEHLLENMEKFEEFNELKKYYLGGD